MADPAAGAATAPLEPVLREELLARAERDQDARHAHAVQRGEGDWSPVAAVDADNLAFLAPLLEQRGWLGSDLVGEDGANACWLLVQHCPSERQDAWLPLMEQAVTEGRAAARDLVYLQDRVHMHHNRRQTHGTQHLGYRDGPVRLWPVTNPDTLNARRAALDLPPIGDATVAGAWTAAELAEHGRHLIDPTI